MTTSGTSRKFFVLANPKSGSHRQRLIRNFIDFLENNGLDHALFETSTDKKGTQTVAENLDDTFTDLVIIGGDGTINEAVNGLKFDIPVGFIPAGSGDDFLKNIDIGASLPDHFDTVVNGKVIRIDLGVCNGRKFINGVGVGFDGQIVADMQKRRIPLLKGYARYYFHVLTILAGYRHRQFDLVIDGTHETRELILLTVANGTTFGGGFKLTPEADITDGYLDVCTVGKISGFSRFLNIHRLQKGTHGVLSEVDLLRAIHVSIGENPLLEGHIDGEYLGNPPFDISMLPGALNIRVRQPSKG